jgi:hypothetical protein
MWPSYREFFTDIWKKLLISVLSVPILSIATIVYYGAISKALSLYSFDWYSEYWYLVLTAVAFACCQGYVIYKLPSGFFAVLVFALLLCVMYSIYSLNLYGLFSIAPLWVFFIVFHIMLFQFVVIFVYISYKIAFGILKKN